MTTIAEYCTVQHDKISSFHTPGKIKIKAKSIKKPSKSVQKILNMIFSSR